MEVSASEPFLNMRFRVEIDGRLRIPSRISMLSVTRR